jgi:hypothetical protein
MSVEKPKAKLSPALPHQDPAGVLCLDMIRTRNSNLLAFAAILAVAAPLCAQQPAEMKPEVTEVWTPVPAIVTPGANDAAPPSDAIVLFNGKNLEEWVSAQDQSPAQWTIAGGI